MKKKILSGLFLLLLAVSVFASVYPSAFASIYPSAKEAAAEKGPWRFTHFDPRVRTIRFKTFVYMTPPTPVAFAGTGRGGYPHFLPRATAYIRSGESAGYPRTTITINTKDLPSSFTDRSFFEVWTIDDDTGYARSFGIFFTSMGGSAEFEANYLNYIGVYDRIVITKEPFYDNDPTPGEIVLEGLIEKREPDYFRPEPKQSMMITDVIKTDLI